MSNKVESIMQGSSSSKEKDRRGGEWKWWILFNAVLAVIGLVVYYVSTYTTSSSLSTQPLTPIVFSPPTSRQLQATSSGAKHSTVSSHHHHAAGTHAHNQHSIHGSHGTHHTSSNRTHGGHAHLPHHSDCSYLSPQLDEIVSKNGSRLRLFITYHNTAGEEIINSFTCNGTRKWVVPVFCNTTKYFELFAYRSIFQHMTLKDFKDVDYVLIAGYKSFAPYHPHTGYTFSLEDMYFYPFMKFVIEHPEYQVFPLWRNRSPINKELPYWHGEHAVPALTATLQAMKWNDTEIQSVLHAHAINRNTFLTTPTIFLEVAKYMSQMMDLVDSTPTLDNAFKYDAFYARAVPEIAKKLFGVTYYHLYGFVFERFPTAIMHHLQVTMYDGTFEKMMKEMKVVWPPKVSLF